MCDDPDIHHAEIAARYEELEREVKIAIKRALAAALIAELVAEYGLSVKEVTLAVMKHKMGEPN